VQALHASLTDRLLASSCSSASSVLWASWTCFDVVCVERGVCLEHTQAIRDHVMHGLDGGNFIEALVDAKRAGRNRDIEASLNAGYCEVIQ